jgi:hypothetical protein
MMYLIYDENGELMRWTRYRAEANQIIKVRQGWSYKGVRKLRPRFDWSTATAAPF